MADFGPYGTFKLNPLYTQVTFWDFDEGAEETNLIRFPMSQEVVDAIKAAFVALGSKPEGGNLYFRNGWSEAMTSNQQMSDYVDLYAEIFKNAEVIPYIYPLQLGREAATSGDYTGQGKYIASTFMSDKPNPLGLALGQVNTWKNEDIIMDPNTATAMQIEACNSYSEGGSDSAQADKCRYIMLDMLGGLLIASQRLMNKQDAESIVMMPKVINRGGFMGGTPSSNLSLAFPINEELDLYNYDATGAVGLSGAARSKWPFCDELLASSSPSFVSDPKVMCSGVWTYNNDNDEEISDQNPRSTIMERYAGEYDSTTLSTVSPNQNGYYFFVKTEFPSYEWPGGGDQEDLPNYQYWAFNINALFYPMNTSGYNLYYNNTSASNSVWGNEDARRQWWPENVSAIIPGGNTGLPMCSTTKYVSSGWSGYTNIPYAFYVPFAYYIKNNTSFFENAELYTFSWQGGEINSPPRTNAGVRDSYPTRNGVYINAPLSEWKDFFINGLGLWTTTTDVDELLNKKTSDWETPPTPPEPPVPPVVPQPGSGGQPSVIGGGTGDYSTNSDPVTPDTTSTGGARLSKMWNMNAQSIESLQKCMVDPGLWESISNIFKSDFREGLISCYCFPFRVTDLYTPGSLETVAVLNTEMTGLDLPYPCQGYQVPKNATTSIQWGIFDIKERFGSFLDYQGTSIDLYLPFIGHVSLTPPSVMGRRIKIIYDVSLTDGSVSATVWATHNRNNWSDIEGNGYYPICTQNGQIGTLVELGSSDKMSKIQEKAFSGLGVILGAGATIATGGAAAAPLAAGAIGGGVGNFISQSVHDKPTYQAGGSISGSHTFATSTKCVLTITYPETDMPNNYVEIAGYASNLNDTLGTFTGFTACDMVKLNGLACTDTEQEQIKSLLESGVVING